ncbi:MAG: DUF1501 domain-containing protein [Betaproteobacteria bacterium]|nr:MAG: DUF1501 domain-containing protein [Betaproteobacteria bacterium]
MNRRKFIQSSAALSAIGAAPFVPFSISTADAGTITPSADESGYRALVCLFLFGGNDSHNMIVPFQTSEYNSYAASRNGQAAGNGLALPLASLLPISPTGLGSSSLGFHPAMPSMQALFADAAKPLAIVANTGPLLSETTLSQYQTSNVELPPQLFSHSDMQMHWQSMRPDQPAVTGWGGRIADVFRVASSGRLPVSIGLGGGGIFMKGDIATPYQVMPVRYASGAIDPRTRIARTPVAEINWNWTGSKPQDVFINDYSSARANLLEQQYGRLTKGSLEIGEFVGNAMYAENAGNYSLRNAVPWSSAAGVLNNPLAAQLHAVAAMIAARQALGTTRQVFFVSLGGFDNHGDQFGNVNNTKSLLAGKHYSLLSLVDQALKTFYDATVSMGVSNLVTTMTMSDFGRTLKSNGQGSDHGWGSHQLVLGGAVNGGRVYGDFPFAAKLPLIDIGQGRLLPEIAADVYTARLAQWFGANSTELATIFPNLSRFPSHLPKVASLMKS